MEIVLQQQQGELYEMSFYKWSICFAILFFCIFVGVQVSVDRFGESVYERVQIDEALNTSIDAAVDGIVLKADGYSVKVSREKCADNFYRTLYACLGVDAANEQAKELLNVYIPIIAFVDEDGFYTQYSEEVNGKIMKVWSPKTTYTKEYLIPYGSLADSYLNCVVDYTLTDKITIRVGGKVYSDNWETLKRQYKDGEIGTAMQYAIFASDSAFQLEKESVITDTIVDRVSYYVNRHNRIAAKYGVSRIFQLPSSARSEIARSVNDVSFLAFFEGYPIGRGTSEVYTKFGIGGARIVKNEYYFVEKKDGFLYYHKAGCSELKSTTQRYQSREECALLGAMPCDVCNP